MFARCKRCGGPLFLEVDLGGLLVLNCVNCGYEQYLSGDSVKVQDGEKAAAASQPCLSQEV